MTESDSFSKPYLKDKYTLIDAGTNSSDAVDYADYGHKVAKMITSNRGDLGIVICGTGIGIGISANKIRGCRAAICSDPYLAKMSRAHNNANVLALGSRVIGEKVAKIIVDIWLNTEFLGGRHKRRVDKIENWANMESYNQEVRK